MEKEKILNKYKCKNPDDYLVCLPVYNRNGEVCAYLRPITANYETTIPGCVELMSRWREENPTISTGVFKVTHARTKTWLDKFVVNNNNRIIFLIMDFTGKYLGHIGLAGLNSNDTSAEIDSVLRGDKNALPGLMEYCLNSIVDFARKELDICKISLMVFEDNVRAVNFYARCGFVKGKRIPLVKVVLPDEEKWEIDEDADAETAEKIYLEMMLP